MNEWYAVRNSTTADVFLARNKEVKRLSYRAEMSGLHGRLWVEDVYGNSVLIITDIPDGVIKEIRCYAPDDPSFIIFVLVNREGSLIMPEISPMFFYRHSDMINNKDYEEATAEFLSQIKKNKKFKNWTAKS